MPFSQHNHGLRTFLRPFIRTQRSDKFILLDVIVREEPTSGEQGASRLQSRVLRPDSQKQNREPALPRDAQRGLDERPYDK